MREQYPKPTSETPAGPWILCVSYILVIIKKHQIVHILQPVSYILALTLKTPDVP